MRIENDSLLTRVAWQAILDSAEQRLWECSSEDEKDLEKFDQIQTRCEAIIADPRGFSEDLPPEFVVGFNR